MKSHTCIISTTDITKLSKNIETAHSTLQYYLLEHIKGEVSLSLGQIEFVIKKLRENVDNLEKFSYEAYDSLSNDEKYKLTEKDYERTCNAASTREWLESGNATPMSKYDEFLKEKARREAEKRENKDDKFRLHPNGSVSRARKEYIHTVDYYVKRGLPVPENAKPSPKVKGA